MSENAVFEVIAKPHPFRAELIQGVVPVGCTLAEMGAGGTTWAWVNGERFDNLMYAPAAGDRVVMAAVPAGGGSKDGLFIVASLALAVASAGTSLYVQTAIGGTAGTILGAMAGAAVGIVGGLLVNALIPPPDQNLNAGASFQPFNAVQRTNNRISPFEPVPVLLGQHRVFPPYASQPVPVTNGGQQDFLGLFCVGQRNINIDDATFKLGETPLANYAEAEYRIWDYTRDEDLGGLFPIGAVTDSNPGDLKTGSATVTRTSPTGTRRVEIEVGGGPLGWFGDEDGKVMAVPFYAEYRVAGSADPWTKPTLQFIAGDGGVSADFPEGVNSGMGSVWTREDDNNQGPAAYVRGSASDVRTYTVSVGFDIPVTGQYEVRISRMNARHPVVSGVGDFSWSTSSADGEFGRQEVNLIRLRYIRDAETSSTVSYELDPAYSYVALKLKASDQLSGVVDDFNLVAQAVVPAWDGADWVETATNNPAWCYRYVLTGERNGRPVALSKVDEDTLKAWGAACDAETPPREFNGEFTARTTVFDALRAIASAGRAAFSVRDSKYSVVRDVAGLTPVQIFTPRNTWDFSGTKVFPRTPHGLKVKFHDRDRGWSEAERIVYDDGYSEDGAGATEVATVFEQLALFGCTHKDQAYKDGRYNLAVGRLRPETFTWQCALENIVCTRGDVVRLQHDAMLVGLGAGRIKALNATTITLDESLVVEVGKTYQARVRKADGTQALLSITNGVGESNVLTISGGVPAGIAVGDLVALGESGAVTIDVLITGIDPSDDLNATITAVPYSSPGVHDAETGTIPAYDPGITAPQLTPPAPYIVNTDSSAEVGGRTSGGDFIPRVFVQYAFPESPALILRAEAQYREAATGNWTPAYSGPNNGTALFETDGSQLIDYRVRGVSDTGIPGAWTEVYDYELETSHGFADPTISLLEQINNPATPNQDLSTVIATVTPPDPTDPAYSHSIVEYRRTTQLGWTIIGTTDQDDQIRVVLPRNGLEYEFRARRVNTSGLASRFGATASITLSLADGTPPGGDPDVGAPESATLDVENLRIYGELVAETEFTGSTARVEWDAATPPVGETLRDYRVRVIETSTGNVLRVEYVVGTNYGYPIETNTADSVLLGYTSPRRALTFEVIARTVQGTRSDTPASKNITNPAPTLPGGFAITASQNTIRLRFTPDDPDYLRAQVFLSTSNGFTPADANKVYDGFETNPIELTGLSYNTTYYLVVRLYDQFGVGADSAQYTQATGAVPAPGTGDTVAPAGVTSPTATAGLEKVVLEWVNPADADLRAVKIYRGTSAGFTADGSSLIATQGGTVFVDVEVVNGTAYYYKFQAVDFAGNVSAVSSAVGPATPFKIDGSNIGSYIANAAITEAQLGATFGGGNVLRNSSFEIDTDGNGMADQWTTYALGTGSNDPIVFSLQTAPAGTLFGTKVQRASATNFIGAARALDISNFAILNVPWLPGVAAVGSGYITANTTSGRDFQVVISYVDAGGGLIANYFSPTIVTDGTYKRVSVKAPAAPALTAFIHIYFRIYGTASAATLTLEVDNAQIEAGDVLTAYAPRADEILAGTISAVEIADNAITAPKILAGAVVAGKIAADAVTAGNIAANAVRTRELIVGDFTNLAENADLELGNVGWVVAASMAIVNLPSEARRGSYVMTADAAASSGAVSSNSFNVRCMPGDVFYAQCYIKWAAGTVSGSLRVEIRWLDESGALLSNTIGNVVNQTNTTYTLSFCTGTAPANTAAARISVRKTSAVGSGTGYVDDFYFGRVVGSALIQDAAIVTAKINDLAVTSAKIQSLDVAKLTAGTMTAAIIQSSGHIAGGKSSYADSTAGYFLGFDSGTAKLKVGDASKGMDWNGSSMTVTGVIQTATSGQRVVLTSGNETEFYDDYGSLAASIGINADGSDFTYLLAGVTGGNATQDLRNAITGVAVSGRGVLGRSTSGAGVAGISTSGQGLYGSSNGPGVYGSTNLSGTAAGIGTNAIDQAKAGGGVFSAPDGFPAVAAQGGYAGVFKQNVNTAGASLLLKPDSSITTAPTHTAEAGSFCVRYISSVAKCYIQTAGGFGGTGSTWTLIGNAT